MRGGTDAGEYKDIAFDLRFLRFVSAALGRIESGAAVARVDLVHI
jgi:hypothetical protein